MHFKNFSLASPINPKPRPKALKLLHRDVSTTNNSLDRLTPHFNYNDKVVKSSSSYTSLRSEIRKPPKFLPPLQPLMHSPNALKTFIFKKPKKLPEDLTATFRVIRKG